MKYHRHCFDDPALPLALASAVRFSFSGLPPITFKLPAASSLRASPSSRVLPSYTYPTAAAIRSSHGLYVPTAHRRIRGPPHASLKLPATFRLQGLITLLTVYSLESRAGSVSHRQRSWDSPLRRFFPSGRFHCVSAGKDATYRLPPSLLPTRNVGPADGAAVPGSIPSGSALRPHGCLNRRPPAPSLGFSPLGPACGNLDLGLSPGLLSHASRVLAITRRIRWRLRVSIGCRLASPGVSRSTHRPKPPLWGFCTCPILSIRAAEHLGYLVRLPPGRTLLPTRRWS